MMMTLPKSSIMLKKGERKPIVFLYLHLQFLLEAKKWFLLEEKNSGLQNRAQTTKGQDFGEGELLAEDEQFMDLLYNEVPRGVFPLFTKNSIPREPEQLRTAEYC